MSGVCLLDWSRSCEPGSLLGLVRQEVELDFCQSLRPSNSVTPLMPEVPRERTRLEIRRSWMSCNAADPMILLWEVNDVGQVKIYGRHCSIG